MKRIVVALLLVAAPAACGPAPTTTSAPPTTVAPPATPTSTSSPVPTPRPVHSPDPALPYEGDWTLVSGESPEGPIPVSTRFPITLALEGRRAGGSSTCNGYGGRFWITGTAFEHDPMSLAFDQAGCVNRKADVAETRYIQALITVDQIAADETTLRLTGPGAELVYERLPDPDLAALVDVTWVSGDETLRLSSDGAFRSTRGGCHVVVGTWGESTGMIHVPEARVVRDCPRAEGSGSPIDETSGGLTFTVEGRRLTITFEGVSVVYRKR